MVSSTALKFAFHTLSCKFTSPSECRIANANFYFSVWFFFSEAGRRYYRTVAEIIQLIGVTSKHSAKAKPDTKCYQAACSKSRTFCVHLQVHGAYAALSVG